MFINIKITVVLFVNEAASPSVEEWALGKAGDRRAEAVRRDWCHKRVAVHPHCSVQGQMAQKLAESLDWERYLPQLSENDGFQWI